MCTTVYSLGGADIDQRAVINVSVAIIFAQLLVVTIYHAFKYTVPAKVWKNRIYQQLCMKFRAIEEKGCRFGHRNKPLPVNTNTHQFNDCELLDVIDRPDNTSDYNTTQILLERVEPTQSVIELPHLQLAPALHRSMEKVTENIGEQEVAIGPCQ